MTVTGPGAGIGAGGTMPGGGSGGNAIGVVVAVPSRAMVVVQMNGAGNPSGWV